MESARDWCFLLFLYKCTKDHNNVKINRFGTEWLLLPKEDNMRKLIPVNTSYYISESKEMKYGDGVELFPEQSKVGDRFITSDYIYTFEKDGWRVKVKNNAKTKYQAILGSINGVEIISVAEAFSNCRKMKVAPAIPNGVKDVYEAFSDCVSLEKAPIIPESVYYMDGTFRDCEKLIEAPKIPDSVLTMDHSFSGCESLTKASKIPNGVKIITGTFSGCKKLTEAPKIPDGVKDLTFAFCDCESMITPPEIPNGVSCMNHAFSGCKKLTEAPKIPDGVRSLEYTFYGCESLTTAPEIPKSVSSMDFSFSGCTALKGVLICHADPTFMMDTLCGTKITAIEGSCSEETKLRLIAMKNRENV